MSLNYYSIVPLISSIVVFSLGLFTFLHNRFSPVHKRFFWLCSSVFLWPLSMSIFLNISDPRTIILITKIGHIACTVAPVVVFDLVITLLKQESLLWVIRLYYWLAALMLLPSWFTNWYFSGRVVRYAWGPYAVPGPLMIVDALVGSAALVVCWILLYRACKRGRETLPASELNKLRYLTVALIVFSFAMLDYLPKYGVPILPVGSIAIAIFAVIVMYAIVRHHLLDITLAIRRTVIYSVLVALTTALYVILVFVAEKFLQSMMGYRSLVVSGVAGFAIALGFTPLKEFVQRAVDRLFFRGSVSALAQENDRLRQEVTRAERLKVLGTLAAGMAHEIKNPLTAIKTFTDFLPERHADTAFVRKFHYLISAEAEKIQHLVQQLLLFAKPDAPQYLPTRLIPLMDETLDLLYGECVTRGVAVERCDTEREIADHVMADTGQLRQIFLNLFLNSLEAMLHGGRLSVSAHEEPGHINITIADTGIGISPEDLKRIGEPFFTTKPNGTGLGLMVVRELLTGHHATITFDSQLGLGTRCTMKFPLIQQSAPSPEAASRSAP